MRLRTALLCFSLLPLAPVVRARAQAGDQLYTATRLQLDVTKVLVAQENAWNRGDLDGYLAHYKDAPETEAVLASTARGMANIRAAFHANYPTRESMGQIENSEVTVRALGEKFALATGRYHLIRSKKAGGEAMGTFLSIMEKTDTGWRIIFTENT
jgi:uncharacterized protein (TIGR02246 family)